MGAPELLQILKSQVESQSQIEETETLVTPITSNNDAAEITVMLPVFGGHKLVRIVARELGVYEGLGA